MDRPHPKERVLLDLVSDERLKGYRVLIYAGYTREIIGRTNPFRGRRGFRVVVMKADVLKFLARKLQRSLAAEGELPEGGLASNGDEGDDRMLALARRIVARKADADSVESGFAEA